MSIKRNFGVSGSVLLAVITIATLAITGVVIKINIDSARRLADFCASQGDIVVTYPDGLRGCAPIKAARHGS